MAPAFILMGSVTGFVTALFAYFLFDASLLAALAIWIGSGPISAILSILAQRGGAAPQDQAVPELA